MPCQSYRREDEQSRRRSRKQGASASTPSPDQARPDESRPDRTPPKGSTERGRHRHASRQPHPVRSRSESNRPSASLPAGIEAGRLHRGQNGNPTASGRVLNPGRTAPARPRPAPLRGGPPEPKSGRGPSAANGSQGGKQTSAPSPQPSASTNTRPTPARRGRPPRRHAWRGALRRPTGRWGGNTCDVNAAAGPVGHDQKRPSEETRVAVRGGESMRQPHPGMEKASAC